MAVTTHERIRYWRKRLDLSQEQLGERCEMPQYKISRIETGETSATVEDLEVIVARGLRISMTDFYEARAKAS